MSSSDISQTIQQDAKEDHSPTMNPGIIDQATPTSTVSGQAESSIPITNEFATKQEDVNMNDDIQVYNPISQTSTPRTELDEQFFEPTLSDVQSHHSSVLSRNKKLNEAPLLTSKFRDAEKAEKEKLKKEKWPNTTIRIKFSDGTIIQHVFPSSSPIQPVYDFIRIALNEQVISKPFILYQPPKTKYPEHPIPSITTSSKAKTNYAKTSIIPPANYGHIKGSTNIRGLQGGTGSKTETLYELGLVPQSVLLIRWEDDDELNASSYPAPIKDHLKAHSQPLPPSVPRESSSSASGTTQSPIGSGTGTKPGEKKIPKWLQKGLLKKKM
ncbi:uncharacterized protein L201_005756 [Kwoniella dendrophila CBS 6074]|uniref:UBX domain-containing protein n=1 Tax=Kwoniella dendrophila CBS 6074 TaxID=1295534 RepID=A0AAX4K114_9TREE